ncbi:MAG TPA: hypothetical protein DC064_16435, partial [Cyanobacteria bacterium UBA9273]|nr:hypothetical protein [Cyanobacteria bacterium UBA9273]
MGVQDKQFLKIKSQILKIMSTFRDFVAVGVGTAIALLYIKPGASKDLPSLTQSEHQVRIHETDVLEYREWTGKEDGGKEALFSTSPATLASPTVQDKPVFINHSSMLTDGEILGRDATINHEHYPHPIPTSTGIEIIAQQQDKGKFAENSHISAVEQLQLQQEHLASLNLSQSITHDRKNSDGHYQLHSQLKDENISLSHPSSGV